MNYLCLISAEVVMEQMTPEAAERHYAEYRDFTDAIRASGHLISCNRLKPPAEAMTVRVRSGQTLLTDGPYVETKEQMGGYYVIQAKDLNEAIQIAARIPGARHGGVEVRPIADDQQTREALSF
ncbi:MAG TPA: YciI family protein [Lacipirellulaceae bacterium]|nr:YciI family protein [Lacipirellulaceae bacterium]